MRAPSPMAVYNLLPPYFQTLACSVEGYRLKRRRYDDEFKQTLRSLRDNTFASEAAIRAVQADRLEKMFAAARQTSYGKQCEQLLSVCTDPFEQLFALPVLKKRDVKREPEQFINHHEHDIIFANTSGSTGSALIFPTTVFAEKMQFAMWWRYRLWHGLELNTWCGYFGGRSVVPVRRITPPFWRVNLAGKQIMFSAYHLSERRAPNYVEGLNEMRPPWLHGYPSQLSLLASYIKKSNLKLSYRPKLITTGAEILLANQRALLNEVFECPVRQHYGLAEGVANISECPYGHLHIDEDYSIVELIQDDDSDLYRIIGTGLFNTAFPLLRYDTGDLAKLGLSHCDCGRPGRVVSEIVGRSEEIVVSPDRTCSGRG